MKQGSQTKTLLGIAKTRVARWLDTSGCDDQLRSKILRGVEAIWQELPKRRDWFEVITVGLDGGGDVPISIRAPLFRAIPVGDCLGVSSVVPGWGFGWGSILRDEEVHDILAGFLHFARQYIHRANLARVLMVAWEEHSRILHPFGSRGRRQRYGPEAPLLPLLPHQEALDEALNDAFLPSENDGANHAVPTPLSTSAWLHRNTFDPFLHQAVFYCLRGHDLRQHDFEIEAVVAFDCALQSVAQLLCVRGRLTGGPSRREVCNALGLPTEAGDLAEYCYFLRNNFGAHAGGWCWWDTGEMIDNEQMDEVARLAQEVVSSAADAEVQMRAVNPDPEDWTDWFFRHFEMLWDAVWVERFDQWRSRQPGA
jgi:hypothetical protein